MTHSTVRTLAAVVLIAAGCVQRPLARDVESPTVAPAPQAPTPIRSDSGVAPVGALTGRVVDSGGRGVPEVAVIVRGHAPHRDTIRRVTMSDSQGAFTHDRLPAGSYSLMARRIGLESHAWQQIITAGRRDSVVIAMRFSPERLLTILTCSATDQPAIQLEVRDILTRAPVNDSVFATARDGAYFDTLRVSAAATNASAVTLVAASGRAGLYEVTVTRPGYRQWTRTGIRVTRGECGLDIPLLQAWLQPVR